MAERFCSNCGVHVAPGARFCAACGAPVAAEAGPAPENPATAAPQEQVQPSAGASAEQQPGLPTGSPWGAPPSGPGQRGSGRGALDALLTGDWIGALRAAGIAVLAMLGISLIGVLLLGDGELGFSATVAFVFSAVCLAVGGDAYGSASVSVFDESGGGSVSIGFLPLTATVVGLGLLAWSFGRRLRRRQQGTTRDVLLQGVRTALVFTALFLPLSLLTRYGNDDPTSVLSSEFSLAGRVGVSVFSTLFGALLFAVAALGLVWLGRRPTVLPGRGGFVRDLSRAPLVGAVLVFAAGFVGAVLALVYVLAKGAPVASALGGFVLGAGNLSLASVLWSAGAPMGLGGGLAGLNSSYEASYEYDGSYSASYSSGSDSVTLVTFTDQVSAWFWLAPVLLAVAMALAATALAVRQHTVEDARREGLRFAGALAAVAFVSALLLRIAADVSSSSGSVIGYAATSSASATFNPFLAAVVLALWGAAFGLLAPVLAAKVPAGFVTAVRKRFGTAPQPAASQQPAHGPMPPGQGYAGPQSYFPPGPGYASGQGHTPPGQSYAPPHPAPSQPYPQPGPDAGRPVQPYEPSEFTAPSPAEGHQPGEPPSESSPPPIPPTQQ